jgi:cytochrome c-type biogenesis protein CcmH/NrfF
VIVAPKSQIEKDRAGQDRLHVRHVRAPAHFRLHVFDGRSHARRIGGLVAKGMTNDEIINYFVAKYGSQEVLASPIDQGFNRLAWLLPYGIGAAGVVWWAAWRFDGRSGRARRRPSRQRPSIRDSKASLMTNSATSTKAGAAAASGFQAWHFFVLLSMIGATVVVIVSRRTIRLRCCC